MSQSELARRAGLTQPTISSLEKGDSNTSGSLASIAQALGVSALWLETGLGERDVNNGARQFSRLYRDGQSSLEYEIPLLDFKGSCGSGRLNFMEHPDFSKTIAITDKFLTKFHVKPSKLVALYADGDSMANFIIDGDIMFFDLDIDGLQSGSIYLFDTDDGLRVKRIYKRLDGRVVLSSDNPDNTRYPDESYTSDEAAGLRIKGKFVFRIGG